MDRATTPVQTFKLPEDTSNYTVIEIVYKQGPTKLKKTYMDGTLDTGMVLSGDKVIVTLTQEEANTFSKGKLLIKLRAKDTSGIVKASQDILIDVKDVPDDGIL